MLNNTIAELKGGASTSEERIRDLETQLEAAESQLEADITVSYTGASQAALEIEILRDQVNSLQAELDNESANAAEEFNTALKAANLQIEALTESIDAREIELEQQAAAFQKDMVEQTFASSLVSEQLQVSQEAVKIAKLESSALHAEFLSLKSSLEAKEQETASLLREKTLLESNVASLSSELKLLQESVSSLSPAGAAASQDMSAQENMKLFNAMQSAKELSSKSVEALSARLGATEAELSKYMVRPVHTLYPVTHIHSRQPLTTLMYLRSTQASCQELEERAERAEQTLVSSFSRESQASGDEEALRRRVGQLQTERDLLRGEKENLERKLKSVEIDLRDVRAAASVSDDKLNIDLCNANKALKKLEDSRGDVASMADAIKALETK